MPALRSVGDLEMGRRLRGELGADEAFEQFVRATLRLAKRQRTWFRGQTDARWFHPDQERSALLAAARRSLDASSRTAISALSVR